MIDRNTLLAVLDTITTARQEARAGADAARSQMLAVPGPYANEEIVQTTAAIARQLNNAANELVGAIRAVDQYAHEAAT